MQTAPTAFHCMFHNLTHLELSFDFVYPFGSLKWSTLIKLLGNFPKLQTLIIHEVFFLLNIKHFHCPLFFRFYFYIYLFIFKTIQCLYHCQVDIVHNFSDRYWKEPKIVPECLLSHLTTCSLRNYSRINCEFPFAKYIMQNSRVLRTMAIHTAKFLDTNTKLQMFMELSLCSRNSATCQLLFI